MFGVSGGEFTSLKAMQGALYVAHIGGRLWRYDGSSVSQLTSTPFSSTEPVSVMAEYQGVMFFGTTRNRVWRSLDAASFVDTTADERNEFVVGSGYGGISDLAVWNGRLYASNYENYHYSAKVFRSVDGENWDVVLVSPTYGHMGFVEDAPDRLYVGSVENAGGPSFKIRASKDGLAWEDVWYTTSEGKNLYGSPDYFSQTDRAYFTAQWYPKVALAPVRDDPTGPGSSLIEPRLPTPRPYHSIVEANGRLFGIGPRDHTSTWDTSPYAISLIGNYRLAVDVGGATLTTVIDGGRGNDFLSAGGGSDILLGGDGLYMLLGEMGNELLKGGPGRSLLIGGDGQDVVRGSSGDTILIGGRTIYDANDLALATIMADWSPTRPSFQQRSDDLDRGISDPKLGLIQLKKRTTVPDDATPAHDVLFGGRGGDWFFDFSPPK